MADYITSDLHIGHKRIIELCGRPFASVDEMDSELVKNWNYEVENDDDRVYILGDLAMGSIRGSLDVVKELRGRKYLVPGNHDRVHPVYSQKPDKAEEMRRLYEDAGLTILGLEVDYWPDAKKYADGMLPWKMCHFPVAGNHTADERYSEYRPSLLNEQWLIHGHVHELWRVRGRQINVGVDVWDYTPVRVEVLRSIIALGPVDPS